MNPERVVRLLSDNSRAILSLRGVGYDWKEIGRFLGVSGPAARKTFQEELRLAIQIADHPESRQAESQMTKRGYSISMRINVLRNRCGNEELQTQRSV
jgi:hypothetical protein